MGSTGGRKRNNSGARKAERAPPPLNAKPRDPRRPRPRPRAKTDEGGRSDAGEGEERGAREARQNQGGAEGIGGGGTEPRRARHGASERERRRRGADATLHACVGAGAPVRPRWVVHPFHLELLTCL